MDPPAPVDETSPPDFGLRAAATDTANPSFLLTLGDGDIDSSSNGGAGGFSDAWNGAQWTVLASPVNAVSAAAVSQSDAWAVGGGIEQWNGSAWTQYQAQSEYPGSNLEAVSAQSANDAWVVGQRQDSGGKFHTFIEQWNGADWGSVPAAPLAAGWANLVSVSTLPNGSAWAVGSYAAKPPPYTSRNSHPLIERYSPC